MSSISFTGTMKCFAVRSVSVLGAPLPPAHERVVEVVLLGPSGPPGPRALVVQREAVGLDIVEPDVIGLAALGEDQDGGRHAGVGLEHARGQRDHRLELVLLHQQSSASAVCAFDEPNSTPSGTMTALRPPSFSIRRIRATKSSSVFFVFTLPRQRRVNVGLVQAALERRIGQDHVEAVGRLLGKLLRERVAERVLVVDVRDSRRRAASGSWRRCGASSRRSRSRGTCRSGCARGTAPAGRPCRSSRRLSPLSLPFGEV